MISLVMLLGGLASSIPEVPLYSCEPNQCPPFPSATVVPVIPHQDFRILVNIPAGVRMGRGRLEVLRLTSGGQSIQTVFGGDIDYRAGENSFLIPGGIDESSGYLVAEIFSDTIPDTWMFHAPLSLDSPNLENVGAFYLLFGLKGRIRIEIGPTAQ